MPLCGRGPIVQIAAASGRVALQSNAIQSTVRAHADPTSVANSAPITAARALVVDVCLNPYRV